MDLRGNSLDVIGIIVALCIDVTSHRSVCSNQTQQNNLIINEYNIIYIII